MSFYSDKLAHVQVVINCRDRNAPMRTSEDGLAYILGTPFIDDIMSFNLLTTIINSEDKYIEFYFKLDDRITLVMADQIYQRGLLLYNHTTLLLVRHQDSRGSIHITGFSKKIIGHLTMW